MARKESKSYGDKRNRNKRERSSQDKKALIKRIIVGILIALGLVYAAFLFITTNFMGNENYVTEMATKTTVSNTINANAFIVRDEVILDNTTNGTLVYSVDNGAKVRADGVIATAYNDEQDAINKQKINDINEKIAYLEALSDTNTSVNVGVDSVNKQLNDQLVKYIDAINNQNFTNIGTVQDELMSMIYRKQIITGEQGSFSEIITKLAEEKNSLEQSTSNSIGEVKTKYAGYFVHNLDGYENAFDVNSLDRITYNDFQNVNQEEVDNSNTVGKVIKSVNWYIVCPITSDEQTMIEHNADEIFVKLPFAFTEKIPAKVKCTNVGDDEHVMLVLSCNYMNDSLCEIRNETVDILVSSYEGLKISKKALHDGECTKTVTNEDGTTSTITEKTQGVYVEYGNELKFKPVYILYSDEDFVICNDNPEGDMLYDESTVALYDKVVVEGSDLYDGKLLN